MPFNVRDHERDIALELERIALTAPKKKAKAKHKKPKVKGHVKKRVATVIGTPNGETIVLRLKAGNPNKIQVDVGNNGSADWQFNRRSAGHNTILVDDEAAQTQASTTRSSSATTTTRQYPN